MEENSRLDGVATSAAIEDAIVNWANDASRLMIVLLDHGSINRSLPGWFFFVNEDETGRDTLRALDLDVILDGVQSGPEPLRQLILITDFCYLGGFVRQCAGAPPGTQRAIISSTTDERLANFGTDAGSLSFTGFFMPPALRGATIFDCFSVAREAIVALQVPANAPQIPWLDDDGDVARRHVFGNLPAFGPLNPRFVSVRGSEVLRDPQDIELFCELGLEVEAKRVEAFVSYTGFDHPDGQPITNHTRIELSADPRTPGRFTGILRAQQIAEVGTYTILYTAVSDDGFGIDLSAEPVARFVQITGNAAQSHWGIYP